MASATPHIAIVLAAIVMIIVVIAGAGTLLALAVWWMRERIQAVRSGPRRRPCLEAGTLTSRPIDRLPEAHRR
ncbi:MAG: hypothetical protein L0G94_03930 [Brachybacterium sp.]|uniref:hypothetical protein n=1 Tax=Brachybacterium sp. TaxID=1891286 RepID=UPI00264801C4|nr:hypothetical protein [Brachybacterium sp.]MDN5685819.1 hypothetical protein [Brachybacterium sp.]